jgi:hypothetical protein
MNHSIHQHSCASWRQYPSTVRRVEKLWELPQDFMVAIALQITIISGCTPIFDEIYRRALNLFVTKMLWNE